MKTQRQLLRVSLGALLTLVGAACEPADAFKSRCDVGASDVQGAILEGKSPTAPPTTLPFIVRVKLTTDLLVQEVYVGGAPASIESASENTWKATLFEQDLEAARDVEKSRAVLPVKAVDICDREHLIDTIEVPLGPAPGKAVADLAINVIMNPEDECSLPATGGLALVRVSASADSAGATISLKANQGQFTGGTSVGSATQLVLEKAGQSASAEAYYIPASAGSVIFSTVGKGATATPVVLPVVAPPEVDAPKDALTRDLAYTVMFRTRGNMESCSLSETVAGAAEVLLIDPALGVFSGSESVLMMPKSCDEAETVTISVRFLPTAADGAGVTIRCFDTFGQQANAALSVAKKVP